MAYKEGNIIGNPFDVWVKDQIQNRQALLGRKELNNKALGYINTKTPWVRLISSINVDGDDSIAKNNILSGGVTDENGNVKSGLDAYSVGGVDERGYVPLPGILDANVTYYNDGALAKAVVNLRCFNKKQFDTIDKLYMRPGYSVLLEFGWSVYINSKNNIVPYNERLSPAASAILKGGKNNNQFSIYDKILSYREKLSGNYEGVLGMVSNFNWSLNRDGSYDISINIIGYGTLIESLTCNLFPYGEKVKPSLKDSLEREYSVLHRVINKYKNQMVEGSALLQNPLFLTSGEIIDSSDVVIDTEFRPTPTGNTSIKNGQLIVKGTGNKMDETVNHYMTLECLLLLIQKYLVPKNDNIPFFNFDTNINNNFIATYDGLFSSDPNICLIPPIRSEWEKLFIKDGQLVTEASDLERELGRISNFKVYDENKLDTSRGRLMGVFINTKYFLAIIENINTDKEGNVPILNLLKSLLRGVTASLGGYNKLSITVDGPYVKIVDNIPNYKNNPLDQYAKFNIFGVNQSNNQGSFVRNMSLNGQISNDFASVISIGAQANGTQLSDNATSFSTYNRGLEDRIIERREIHTKSENEVDDEIKLNWNEVKPRYDNIYRDLDFDTDDIKILSRYNKQQSSLIAGKLVEREKDILPFFLPFNFKMDIDGLSGMRLYERFRVTDNILPLSYYEGNVDFIIYGIDHVINSEGWVSSISAKTVPRPSKNA